MEGVCSLHLLQRSLVGGLVGFECRHMTASRWTQREGPNSCATDVVVDVVFFVVDAVVIDFFVNDVVVYPVVDVVCSRCP